jgi:alcohol dehydrogenase YqhD (iron-dependent ADH family)
VEVWGVDPSGKTDDEVALEGIAATEAFFARIGAPTRLADYQIGDEHLELMAEKATPFGPIGRFKKLTSEDVAAILRMCL